MRAVESAALVPVTTTGAVTLSHNSLTIGSVNANNKAELKDAVIGEEDII